MNSITFPKRLKGVVELRAVENDLFSIAPNLELIYEIENIKYIGVDSGE